MKGFVFVLLSLLLSHQALADSFDAFNSFRWNRSNELAGNGRVDSSPWFEWWYYKVVLPETGESFIAVYGVVNPWDKNYTEKATRAYATFGDFTGRTVSEQKYPLDDFSAAYDRVSVRVGENLGTDKRAQGHIVGEDGWEASWDFSIDHRWTFNAVSWVTGSGITNIEWYPAQADARCSGFFVSGGKRREFVDAPCYQDRNWGHSFPKWWTWIVSNHFNENGDSALAIGGGKPKVWGADTPIEGVAIGLKHKGVEYTWRPNDFDRVKTEVSFGKWDVAAENTTHRIEVSAWAPPSSFLDLQFTTPDGQLFHDYETLTGKMTVKLFERSGRFGRTWSLLDTLTTDAAGIEYGSREKLDF